MGNLGQSMTNEDECICCRAYVPEGRQVCPKCEKEADPSRYDLLREKEQAHGLTAAEFLEIMDLEELEEQNPSEYKGICNYPKCDSFMGYLTTAQGYWKCEGCGYEIR